MENSPDDRTSWFFVRQGRRQGPFDRRQLVQELLGLESPEDALVWHAGLPAWVKSGEIADLARELPPPIPGAAHAASSADVAAAWIATEPEVTDGPADEPTDPPVISKEDAPESHADDEAQVAGKGQSQRRRHRLRHRAVVDWRPFALPLLFLFMAVMLGLWLLLRRMNEVPPGRIIQEGALSFPALPKETRCATPPEAAWRQARATVDRFVRPG